MKNQYIAFTTILLFAVGSLALSPMAHAVVPAPDGGYPGFNTAEGQSALFSLTTGIANTAVGWFSLKSNAEGSFNTATGAGTLLLNTGDENTATGAGALLSNTTGVKNSANGAFALFSNTEGADNTAVGWKTLFNNTTGNDSTAIGSGALFANTTGGNNVANGFQALLSNTEGSDNTAIGDQALNLNTTGEANTAIGHQALFSNTTGTTNTANGYLAFFSNTTGSQNTAIGADALFSNTTGNGNIALGGAAGSNVTTADNVIVIGTGGANVSDSCFIGNIRGVTTANANAVPVLIDSAGQLGTASSSRRFKKEIKPMDQTSEGILGLKPVTFHYKSDKTSTPQFGLIAEEVAEVNPDLVVRDDKGDIYTVRYEAVNAMLLNEFLKEHRKVEEQEATIAQLKKDFRATVAQLTARLDKQASQIQNVSARLAAASPSLGGVEAKNPAPQMASLSAVALREGGNNQ